MSRRRRLSWGVLGLAALAACWGCGPVAGDVRLTRGFASAATPYGDLLPRYTRSSELYDQLDSVAKGWATWRSPELRAALAETSVAAYRLKGEAAEALRREAERDGRAVREFHLALFTPKANWNDLESPQTLWRAYLYLPSKERREPLQVSHRPKTDKSAVEYPYVSRWTREYALIFPLGEGEEAASPSTLVITGPLGTLQFAF